MNSRLRHILILPAFAALASNGQQPASKSPVQWSASVAQGASGKLLLQAKATIEEGWHVYALELPSDEGPLPTVFTFEPSEHYALVGGMKEDAPEEVEDPNFMMLVRHHSQSPVFAQQVKRSTEQAFQVKGSVEYMVCNNTMCLPPKQVPLVFQVEASAK